MRPQVPCSLTERPLEGAVLKQTWRKRKLQLNFLFPFLSNLFLSACLFSALSTGAGAQCPDTGPSGPLILLLIQAQRFR